MNSKLSFSTWKEEVCPEVTEKMTVDYFNEMLEKLNCSEKNSENYIQFLIWRDTYVNDLAIEYQAYAINGFIGDEFQV